MVNTFFELKTFFMMCKRLHEQNIINEEGLEMGNKLFQYLCN